MPRFKPLHAALLSIAFLGGAAGVAGWEHFSPPLAVAQAQAPAGNPLLGAGLPGFLPLVAAGRARWKYCPNTGASGSNSAASVSR